MQLLILLKMLVVFIILFSNVFGQIIPIEFIEHKSKEILYDSGIGWRDLSTIGPFNVYPFKENSKNQKLAYPFNKKINSDSSYFHLRFGIMTNGKDKALYSYYSLYNKNFYSFLYPRLVTNIHAFPRFTGLPQDRKRLGFVAGEVDVGVLGYQNDKIIVQIGRNRLNWSAGNNISILLSKNSPSYDNFIFGLNLSNVRFKYMHGFLESDTLGYNRFISAKGIEYSNKENLILSFSEVIIYAGINRQIDFAYFNPISTHLEIELNNRQNLFGNESGNAAWQISLDYMMMKKFRFSLNYVIDELVIDKAQKLNGESSHLALSSKLSYLYKKTENSIITFNTSFINIGTKTFRHSIGQNNFVQRDFPLGSSFGSDGFQFNVGLDYLNYGHLRYNLNFELKQYGEESLSYKPDNPYNYGYSKEFPSGQLDKLFTMENSVDYYFENNLILGFSLNYSKLNKNKSSLSILTSVNLSLF